jgi:uncharacterized membrane protein YvlD (DUF360 family)
MEFLAKILLSMTFNSFALLLTSYFEKGFEVMTDVPHLIPLAAMLALADLMVRPALKLIFSPVIGLTLGLFNIVISAGILYVIDIYSDSITINGLWPLVLGAHILALIVTLIDYSSAMIYGSGEI